MWDYYERSSPIEVKGGIKAQTKRGQFSNKWWGKRWIEALESFQDSARLSRGRAYARKGQIIAIDIKKGEIISKVQGSRTTPYKVTIQLDILSENAWQLVIGALSKKALYAARLFAGELPHDIEEIFREVHIPLLPSHHSELRTDCTCPDWSNPCKHVAAVLYLLGGEFDRDPFLLFKLRGMDRETFLKNLENRSLKTAAPQVHPTDKEPPVPLPADPQLFWQAAPLPSDYLHGAFEKPRQPAILPKSLGKFPFWSGEEDLFACLESAYSKATDYAIKLLDSPQEPS